MAKQSVNNFNADDKPNKYLGALQRDRLPHSGESGDEVGDKRLKS
jgi:hypothetical protein